MWSLFKILIYMYSSAVALASASSNTSTSIVPIVLLHGIASEAPNMDAMSSWLAKTFQTKVYNLEIGNGKKTSMYTPMTTQLNELCETIYAIEELKYGFNFIGMSQGGLLARGYVEQCNAYPVLNLITIVSPHGGTVLPNLNKDINMYSEFIQQHLSASNYWRDPRQLESYLVQCSYLPSLNNEYITDIPQAEKQRENIKKLTNMVLIWSPNDEVVNPPESAKFSFYAKDYLAIIPVEDTKIYINDLLGLKYLNEKNMFHLYQTNCTHVQHRDPICFNQLYPIFDLYL